MILITTAGKVGLASADQLAGLAVPVRLLARHPEKAADLAQPGVEVFRGDLDSPESIDQAMRDVLRVILVTEAVLSQELSVIDSAGNARAAAWQADGDCDYVTDDVPQILGRPAGSFGQFAVDYAEAFT